METCIKIMRTFFLKAVFGPDKRHRSAHPLYTEATALSIQCANAKDMLGDRHGHRACRMHCASSGPAWPLSANSNPPPQDTTFSSLFLENYVGFMCSNQ